MTIRLLALALVAALVAVVPTSASAAAILDSLSFSIGGVELTPSTPLPTVGTTVGTRVSVNVANTFTDQATGRIFTIQTAKLGVNPTVFGDDSALDQIGFTDALITFSRGIGGAAVGSLDPVNLSIEYGFGFDFVTVDSQTYGIQIAGAYRRGFALATKDTIDVSSLVRYFYSTETSTENQIAVTKSFSVVTSNTFGPPSPPSGTEIISCSANNPNPGVGSCLTDDVMQTLGVIHFDKVGDSLKIPNSWLTVRGTDGNEVQAFLDAAAAADAAALIPEPSSLLLLGTALAGLGLFRLKHHTRRRGGQDRRH